MVVVDRSLRGTVLHFRTEPQDDSNISADLGKDVDAIIPLCGYSRTHIDYNLVLSEKNAKSIQKIERQDGRVV